MCPSTKTVAQLIAVLGAAVVSGAFVEGHTALPSTRRVQQEASAQRLAEMAIERKSAAR